MYTIVVDVFLCLIKYLCVTWCGSVPLDCSYVLLWIDTVVFYFCSDCLEDYQQYWKWLSVRWIIKGQIFPRRKMVQRIYSSRLEEWLLYHSLKWASCLITQIEYGFERWCNCWRWWCSWSSHDLVHITMLMLPSEWYVLCSRPLPVIPP